MHHPRVGNGRFSRRNDEDVTEKRPVFRPDVKCVAEIRVRTEEQKKLKKERKKWVRIGGYEGGKRGKEQERK